MPKCHGQTAKQINKGGGNQSGTKVPERCRTVGKLRWRHIIQGIALLMCNWTGRQGLSCM